MISESEALGIENELASADAAVRRNALSELKELLDIKKLMPAEPGRDCFLNCRLAPDSGAPAAHSPSHLAYLARKNGWAVTGLLDEAKGAEEFIEAAVYLNIRAAIGLSGCLAGVEGAGPMISYSWRKSGRIEQQALGIPVKRLRLCLQLLQEKLSIKEFNDFFRLCGALPAAVGLTCCPDRASGQRHGVAAPDAGRGRLVRSGTFIAGSGPARFAGRPGFAAWKTDGSGEAVVGDEPETML